MAFEDLKAAFAALLDEILERPEDAHQLQEQLREKIAELEALGLPVPEDWRRVEKELREGGAELLDRVREARSNI